MIPDIVSIKLMEIAKLLNEIEEIEDSNDWIFTSAKASMSLKKVNEWLAIREFHNKIGKLSGLTTDEVRKRCQQISFSMNAQSWLRKKDIL